MLFRSTISGNFQFTGNIIGTSSNTILQAGVYQWVFDNTANLTLPNVASAYINGSYPNGNIILNPQGLGDVYLTPNTQLFVQDTTASTSNTTGAIVVVGGVGITGNVNAGTTNTKNQHQLLSSYQSSPTSSSITANASVLLGGAGSNYLTFGQYPQSSTFNGQNVQYGQWLQSGFNGSATYYPIILNPLGGNVLTGGAIIPSAWTAGQTIKTTMLNNTDVGFTSSVTIGSTTYTQIASYSYTPLSSSSYLIIEVFCVYSNNGSLGDDWYSQITVGGSEITYGHQLWINASGGGTRSGAMFPLMGRYTNSSTSAVNIVINAKRGTSDDNFTFIADDGFWLKITEIAR